MSTKKRTTNRILNRLETLERRQLMAAEITLNAGVLYIEGTDTTKDTVIIKQDTMGTATSTDDRILVEMKYTDGVGNGSAFGNYSRNSIQKIVFNGYGGNDNFNNYTSVVSEADGGAGNDTLFGGWGNDKLYGGDGNDYLDGRTGNDTLYAGAGDDLAFGDAGDDTIYGNLGNDFLYGGAGKDSIWGEGGNDTMDGGPDVEAKMVGGDGVDAFIDDTYSFPGNDFVQGLDKTWTSHSKTSLFDYTEPVASTRSLNRFKAATTPTTPTTPVNLNSQVLAYAQSKLGTKVGDGGCTRLVEGALAAVGAQPGSNFNQPGFYVWGRKLNAGEAMTGGDIIQFAPGTKFQTANSWMQMDTVNGHAAIIESVSGNTITMLNQNMSGSPVIRTTIDLSTIVAGSFSVYRAVPK